MKRGDVALVLGIVVSIGLPGCPDPSNVGGIIKPAPKTALDALGEAPTSCRKVGDQDQPLIVDWKAHERTNLEEAMNDGVAIVHYDCDGIRVLRGCRLDGSYRYLGTSKKEQVLKLESADEIAANMPTFGKVLGAQLSASLARGSTLDLAMVLVGKKRTTVAEANPNMLLGGGSACEGATHFVRGAFVGAFAMGTGTRGEASAVAWVVKASSKSATLASYRDGEPGECTEGDHAPANCHALVRVELAALGARPPKSAPGIDASAVSCPLGLVFSGGKCTNPGNGGAGYQCSGSDPFECLAQCDKNDAPSCVQLANLYLIGDGVEKNPKQAVPLLEKACNAGHAKGCGGLGFAYEHGLGVKADREKGAALFQRACDAGNAEACNNLGSVYGDGRGIEKNEARAAEYLRKACDGGEAYGCYNLGVLTHSGRGVKADDTIAAQLFVRACDGDVIPSCHNAGVSYKEGIGVKPDAARAKRYFTKACSGKERDEKSCAELAGAP